MYSPTTHSPDTLIHSISFDEHGFIVDEYLWTRELAAQIAVREGLGELSKKHWKILEAVRAKYQQLGGMPGMRSVCKSAGVEKYDIYSLFGNCLTVCKVAGLPDPGTEMRNYLR